jgi:hypothetical protein
MTRWEGCCLSTGGATSVCPEIQTGQPTACLLAQAFSYFRLLDNHDSCNSSPKFTRSPSLAPHPPVAGRIRNNSSRSDSAARAGIHCQGAFDGPLRCPPQPIDSWRLNARSASSRHSRWTDNHRRGFTPLRKLDLLSDSRRTEYLSVSCHFIASCPLTGC